VNKK